MQACQYCGAEHEEKYNFCLNCERQVKCVSCGEQLLPEKEFCLVCGSQLISRHSQQPHTNKFTLEEQQDEKSASRRIEGLFSDEAIGQAAALFGGVIQRSKLASRLFEESNSSLQGDVFVPSDNRKEIQGDSNELANEHQEHQQTQRPDESDEEMMDLHSKAASYFKVSGDNELVTRRPDLKGKNIKEQQNRFILLYVWAYNEIFKTPGPSKERVFEDAKRCGVYDAGLTQRRRLIL